MDDKEFEELENKYYKELHKREEKQRLLSKIKEVEKAQEEFFKEDGYTRIEKFSIYVDKSVCYDRTSSPENDKIEFKDKEDAKAILNFYLELLKKKLAKLMEEE